MIHLDTHVAVWLYAEQLERIPVGLRTRMDSTQLAVSPAVGLELAFLHEIGRVRDKAAVVLDSLRRTTEVTVDPTSFVEVVRHASAMTFTRDPFDRLIAGQARAASAQLATKDQMLRDQLAEAVWDPRRS